MTVARRPSSPPVLAGYEVRRLLGMGGFADVFLYEQQHPRRSVAVKVLLAETLDPEVRERFATEADLMAQLSHHPSIVTVHQAAVAADGRPYLVMEYCSRPGLGALYRTERMSVAEVLRIGIRLASAVETAHRAGILHRDIKPANVLLTDFGWPALTDFGIAATTGWSRGSAVGMSIPWSPPELLAENPTGDVRGDVYSLAATIWSVLAGRSPFEVPGGANSPADLVTRIERAPLPATGRADVPTSLQAALARAMEKNPVRRSHSALALARALQAVEHELMLPGTPLELADAAVPGGPAQPHDGPHRVAPAVGAAEDGATRRRPVVTIDPEGRAGASVDVRPPTPVVRTPEQEAAEATRVRPVPVIRPEGEAPMPGAHARRAGAEDRGGDVPLEAPVTPRWAAVRPTDAVAGAAPTDVAGAASAAAGRRGPRRLGASRRVAAAAAVVVVGALAGAVALARPAQTPAAASVADASPVVVTAVPAPRDLAVVAQPDGSVLVTWSNPQPQDGDRYLWGVTRAGVPAELTLVGEPTAVLPARTAAASAGAGVCVEVSIVRADRRASTQPAVGCTS